MKTIHVAALAAALFGLGHSGCASQVENGERVSGPEQAPPTSTPRPAAPTGMTPSGTTQAPSPAVTTNSLRIEGVSAERAADGMRVTLRVTNLADRTGSVYVQAPMTSGMNYMIDDHGNRYKVIDGSDIVKAYGGVSTIPQLPIREWIVFEAPPGDTSQVAVVLRFRSSALGVNELIAVQGIPVRR